MAQQTQNDCMRNFAEVASATSPDPVIWYGDGRPIYANASALRFVGHVQNTLTSRLEEIFDSCPVKIPHPDDGIVEAKAAYRVADGGSIAVIAHCSSVSLFDELLTCVKLSQRDNETDVSPGRESLGLNDAGEIYRAIVANSFNAIILSENGVIREVNDEFLRLSGFGRSEVVGRNLSTLLEAESASVVADHIRRGAEVIHEIRGFTKEGVEIDAEVVGRTLEIGGRSFRLSAIRDITERKKNERGLINSQAQLKLAMDGARLGTFEWGVATGRGHVSDSMYRLFGRSPHEIAPSYRAFARQAHPGDLKRIERIFGIALTTKNSASHEIRVHWPNGETHWLEVRARFTYDDAGNVDTLNGVMVDIDEKKESERQLQQSKSHLSIALEAGRMGTFVWAANRRRLTMSEDARGIVGVPRSLVKPVPAVAFLRQVNPDDRVLLHEAIRSARDGDGRLTSEFRIRDELGRDHWVEVRGQFIRSRDGQVIRLTGVFADIDHRKLAEAELQRAESRQRHLDQQLAHMNRLSSVGEMASTIAHEVNQPLFVVSSTASLIEHYLRKQGQLSDDVADLLSVMTSQAVHAGETIRRIRGFCLNKTSERERVDLAEVIESSLRLLRTELRHASVAATTAFEGNSEADVDPIQIQQVLVNLFRNAIEAMNDTSIVDRQLRISAQRDSGSSVVIQVADTGPGISAERRDAVFAPFESTKNDGMGMGLCISRSIIEAHGGTLTLVPCEAGGATFRFSIPAGEELIT